MSQSSIAVRDALVEAGIPATDITPDASLLDDLSIDSTELIEVITLIEKQLDIHLDEKGFKDIHTVAELIVFVDQSHNVP